MINRTEAIKSFLQQNTHNDLASLYSINMECQVNVARDDGEPIKGEFNGVKWKGYTDHIQTWKAFRIPRKANSDPEYQDTPLKFSLEEHAEGIGMTGWDWMNRVSKWVAFDFDAIVGHSDKHTNKLTVDELQRVQDMVCDIPWVTTRLSTSGNGLHLYVFLRDVPTSNHTEHAALGRSILHLMSANTGFDFVSKVDICGSNMWVWHRKMRGTNGLKVVKQGGYLEDIPHNWRDHLHVVTGKRKCILPDFVKNESQFSELTGQIQKCNLDDEHIKLIKYLEQDGASFWWDSDHHMLVCHTYDLAQAHTNLGMRGVFKTVATGSERGSDHNCFCYPLRRGGWVVRRYGEGTAEASTWDKDASGYTKCFLNRDPDLKTLAACYEGVEHKTGGFVFRDAESAQQAALGLGIDLGVSSWNAKRKTKLKLANDKLVVEMARESHDAATDWGGWLEEKNQWTKVFYVKRSIFNDNTETYEFDDLIRHVTTSDGTNYGWMVRSEGQWTEEPLAHVTAALRSMGLKEPEVKNVIGSNVFKPWRLVNQPFQPEYPGDRQWNRDAAQFRYAPDLKKDELEYQHWMMILQHIGSGLDSAVTANQWCQVNDIQTGADYLKCWCASLFQNPYEPLPYLFLYSPEQATGKSIFHEAISLLMTSGYKRADQALKSKSGFNGELEKAIFCIIEETNLSADKQAYNVVKDCVTSMEISIHIKGKTPFNVVNTTHWVHCSNDLTACPVFDGDTRITMIRVPVLKNEIAKRILIERLKKEASDFLTSLLRLELPECNERLRVPVIVTDAKISAVERSQSLLEQFLSEECHLIEGHKVSIAEFHTAFMSWLDPVERHNWSKQRVTKSMPDSVIKGRDSTAQWFYANLTFDKNAQPLPPFHKVGDMLKQ